MGNGAGAKARFVGKYSAGNTFLHAQEQAAHCAAGKGRRVERPRHNGGEHLRKTRQVEQHHTQSQHHIGQRHKGHQLFADTANTLHAAQQHQRHQHGHYNADDQVDGCHSFIAHNGILVQGGINGGDNGVDLRGVAGAEHRQHAEQSINGGQPAPVFGKAIFDVIHRAAHQLAISIALPEVYRQRDLRKFGAHAQQGGTPHPEHRARPADGNSPRHTGNVAGTHGGRQRGTHRLEGGHCTIGSIPLAEHAANRGFDGIGEFADLDKAGAHTEQQPHADDAHHGGNAPDKVVDCLVDSRDRLQHMLYPYFPLQIS